MSAYFITGTDTEIGKTFSTCALLHAAQRKGLTAVGFKPIAAGAEEHQGVLANEDALALQAASAPGFSLGEINPLCLKEAIAPHIAAAAEGRSLASAPLIAAFTLLAGKADLVLVEGAGGFCVPLDEGRDMAGLARDFGLPVILIVGMRLGCINHALLTIEAIHARGLRLAGWVANTLEPRMSRFEENLETLEQRISSPLLGVLPHTPEGPAAASAAIALPDGL